MITVNGYQAHCLFCRNLATRYQGSLRVCDRLECADMADSSFANLPIGARFKVASWDYELFGDELFGEWIKLSVDGIPNPMYPNLMCNAERVIKTGKGNFAPGDRDYTWVMSTLEIERV